MQEKWDKMIHLREGLTWQEKQIAVELARLLGFESESAVFPVVSRESGVEIPADLTGLKLYKKASSPSVWPKDYVSASKEAKPVPDFDWRRKKGLETLFTVGAILKDEDLDLLPDKMDVQLVMPRKGDLSVLAAACTFAFRLGMETTAYKGLLLTDKEGEGNVLVFEEARHCSITWQEKEKGVRITVKGSGAALEEFAAGFCGHFPLQGEFDTWTDHLQEITDSMCMKNFDGQLVCGKAYAKPGAVVYGSPEAEAKGAELSESYEREFPGVSFTSYKGQVKVYEKEYDIPWEVDCFHEVLEKRLYPFLKPGDKVSLSGALSEGPKEREKAVKRIKESLAGAGAKAEKISVLCAYKQGYSWVEEEIVPALLQKGRVCRIEIGFKPFLPPGVTDWADEDGATPSYNNLGGNPGQWYDLPIRYLQELYPVEDVLTEKLGVGREDIHFYACQGDKDLTYEVKAYNLEGRIIYEDTYQAAWSERPYLDAYPDMGKVHPSTGCLRVNVNGRTVLNERIETDVERIWSLYQSQVLQDVRDFIEVKARGKIKAQDQPLFARLVIEAQVSEPNYKLKSREDLFSTLDGLHEDIYFAGSDYFKNYGMEKAGEILDAPGLILPVIRQKEGKPSMKVTLFDQRAKEPLIVNGSERILPEGSRHTVSVWMEAIEETPAGRKAILRLEGVAAPVAAAYAGLLQKGLLDISGRLFDIDILELVMQDKTGAGQIKRYEARTKRAAVSEKNLDIKDIDLSPDSLIGYDTYRQIIEQLKGVKGLHVFPVAASYMGREIYAVEFWPDCRGYVSRTKRITARPSQIINARHHANEVSGTNSAFMLIKTLLTEEKYRHVKEKVNLVIVPMENVDGAAIHYELQKDNPQWKLHVARFNAVGKEFYHEHFNPHTIHTEALGMTRLFGAFLPDIIVDNHGVPKHEWEQQFSGYTSPSYKGFWLPRSLLYGYFWTVKGEAYKSNYAVNKRLEDVIADSIAADEEITRRNKEWAGQFEKYAHSYMPKLFPANYYKNMINYWIPFAFDPAHRYPSVRFPWITAVAYTSEVADETAAGEYLALCAGAHLTHDLATLEMMAGSTCIYKDIWNLSDSAIEAAHIRQRPVIV